MNQKDYKRQDQMKKVAAKSKRGIGKAVRKTAMQQHDDSDCPDSDEADVEDYDEEEESSSEEELDEAPKFYFGMPQNQQKPLVKSTGKLDESGKLASLFAAPATQEFYSNGKPIVSSQESIVKVRFEQSDSWETDSEMEDVEDVDSSLSEEDMKSGEGDED